MPQGMFLDSLHCFFTTLKFLYVESGGQGAATLEQSNTEQPNIELRSEDKLNSKHSTIR
jgi:hypothetical protein